MRFEAPMDELAKRLQGHTDILEIDQRRQIGGYLLWGRT
jgi:hypothetical protein